MGMIDISLKDVVVREATAEGKIMLGKDSIRAIRERTVRKGDPLYAAELAGISAVKRTSSLLAHCHQLAIEAAEVRFVVEDDSVKAIFKVKATSKTGIEMEALVGASIALLTIWDTVKYLEKDKSGQYPSTSIDGIRIIRKSKGDANGRDTEPV
jgi:cyclic pyranopterin monophosphate synthase